MDFAEDATEILDKYRESEPGLVNAVKWLATKTDIGFNESVKPVFDLVLIISELFEIDDININEVINERLFPTQSDVYKLADIGDWVYFTSGAGPASIMVGIDVYDHVRIMRHLIPKFDDCGIATNKFWRLLFGLKPRTKKQKIAMIKMGLCDDILYRIKNDDLRNFVFILRQNIFGSEVGFRNLLLNADSELISINHLCLKLHGARNDYLVEAFGIELLNTVHHLVELYIGE